MKKYHLTIELPYAGFSHEGIVEGDDNDTDDIGGSKIVDHIYENISITVNPLNEDKTK